MSVLPKAPPEFAEGGEPSQLLRAAAVLSMMFGAGLFLAYLTVLDKTPWSSAAGRHLRAMKVRTTAPPAVEPFTIPEMVRLPDHTPLPVREAIENRGVVVETYVQRMLRAIDGDLHLDCSAASPGDSGRIQDYIVAEVTPQWRLGSKNWGYERLLEAFRARRGGVAAWDGGPRRVRLTGWLLYDEPHERRLHRPGQAVALCAWEIHPVTRIELWDDATGRYIEHLR